MRYGGDHRVGVEGYQSGPLTISHPSMQSLHSGIETLEPDRFIGRLSTVGWAQWTLEGSLSMQNDGIG